MSDIQFIQSKIYEIRGQRVMLDRDLAELYQVETKNLKRSVRANIERFPSDFMFELTKEEYDSLRCKYFTLKTHGRDEHSNMQLDAISTALAELQTKPVQPPRQPIGFVQEDEAEYHATCKQRANNHN